MHRPSLADAIAIIHRCLQDRGVAIASLNSATRVTELGVDSLALVEILCELETSFGVELDEAAIAELDTIGATYAALQRAASARVA